MSAAENSGGARSGPRPASGATGLSIAEAVGPADLEACLALRREVFCIEQGVPEDIEVDGRDFECRHFLLRIDDRLVGTLRTRPIGPRTVKIERVAVRAAHRGGGLGTALMRHVLGALDQAGCDAAVLNAQTHSETFYRALGFAVEGPEFEEAGIPHVRMVRRN